jgi:sulfur-oxidizing protein SoxB
MILEDICDNLFNPDPYKQQGGDMVRIGGLTYTCAPNAKMGGRILDMRLAGKPIEPDKKYKVAGWAPVAEGAQGEPIWDLVAGWLKSKRTIPARKPNVPQLRGVAGNPGIA